jgi:putative effector of murein hydrolase LrgA (UPF0299 family)
MCHLGGSLRIISETDDLDELNDNLAYAHFDEKPTYVGLLFTTIPGITGLLLLAIIIIMAITSLQWVRQNYFQVFGYTHILLFPIFLIALIIHGLGFWFTLGIPYATVLVTPGLIGLMVQLIMRFFADKVNKFEIIDISVSSD